MDKTEKLYRKVDDLDNESVVVMLERWDMAEFIDYARERQLDGRKLMDVTEGIVKLWRPKVNAHKLILLIEDLKLNPNKYLNNAITDIDRDHNCIKKYDSVSNTEVDIESQYQKVKKAKEDNTTFGGVEELLRKIVPAKSFLYRNQPKKNEKNVPSYLPMDAGTQKKTRKLFRISSYEYPFFDLRKFSKQENDRGYYPMKRNSRLYIQKNKKPESRTKYKSISTTEEYTKYPEDHLYEDLCYSDIENNEKNMRYSNISHQVVNKTRIVKIQELFQSFKIPFFKKNEDVLDKRVEVNEKESNIYENSDSIANMYDSVRVNTQSSDISSGRAFQSQLPVEDYLEPIQVNKDYCDVNNKQKEESLLGYIMSIFENRLGFRRETSDTNQSEDSDSESQKIEESSDVRKWNEEHMSRTNMAERPLPVPVENESYYMKIDRSEAENLLKGQPDGAFVLRPSSQPNHAYTLSVSCNNAVHNVGVRRRSDGRLALGYARRGERSFQCVPSLLRYHKKNRLLLIVGGRVIGTTTLNETPQYYQTPCNIPVPV